MAGRLSACHGGERHVSPSSRLTVRLPFGNSSRPTCYSNLSSRRAFGLWNTALNRRWVHQAVSTVGERLAQGVGRGVNQVGHRRVESVGI